MTGKPRVMVLSTVTSMPATLNPLLAELVPHLDAYHVVDERLLRDTIASGLTATTCDRVIAYCQLAVAAGVEAILVTCSSIGSAVDEAAGVVPVPVARIDAPMATEAATYDRVGVLATLSTTLEPTAALIERKADGAGRDVRVESVVVDGAFAALTAGDSGRHDALVAAAAAQLADGVDVLVLAQASMARAVDAAGALGVPVLTSPRSGVAQLSGFLPAP